MLDVVLIGAETDTDEPREELATLETLWRRRSGGEPGRTPASGARLVLRAAAPALARNAALGAARPVAESREAGHDPRVQVPWHGVPIERRLVELSAWDRARRDAR